MMPLLVVAAVISDGKRILLTKRPESGAHPGFWEFPGGKIEGGESPERALKRELLEELGIHISVERVFEVAYYRYEWGPVLILAYQCKIIEGTLCNLGVSAYRWVEPSALGTFRILPADAPIIERLAQDLSWQA